MTRLIRHNVLRVATALLSVCLVVTVCELMMRWGLSSSRTSTFGDPGRYFDPLCDEDYWRALRRGAYGANLHRVGPNDREPRLGWIPARSSLDGQLALRPKSLMPDAAPSLALFGDSFIFGTVGEGNRISDFLSADLPEWSVKNFGVGGYGLDQIVLRHQDRMAVLRSGDVVVIGVLTTDIDRATLKVRDAPKPWFGLDNKGQLVFHPPEVDDSGDWFEHNSIQASMLLWRRLVRSIRLWRARSNPSTEPDCQQSAKQELARSLLLRLGEQCAAQALDCYLLPLYRPVDLEYGAGWRRDVLTSDYGLTVLDSWDWFTEYPAGWRTLYGDDGHPDESGNELIAKRIISSTGMTQP